MKKLILKGFEVQFIMLFFSFMIFATNEFTLSAAWLNIIASTLIIFVYLMLFYADSFKITGEYIRLGKKPPLPVFAVLIVYLVPALILVWAKILPLEFNQAYIIDPGDLENGIAPVYEYTKAVRQNAWFELYMFPYKGIYTLFGSSTVCRLLTFVPAMIASAAGYVNALRGVDVMEKAGMFIRKFVYKSKEN